MKKWQKTLIIIGVVLLGLGILRNSIFKGIVTAGSSHVLGAKVHIDSFVVGIFKSEIKIKGFKVYNPEGFPKGLLIDVNEIYVQYDRGALFKGKIHLPLIVLDLEEMVVVKNKNGELNVDSLKIVKDMEKSKGEKATKKKKTFKQMPLQIDQARLDLGNVIVKDYTKGDNPIVLAYEIGVKDETYKNINSAQEFATLVMLEAMGPAGLKGAGIYGAATLLGVGFLPAGIAATLISKDTSVSEYEVSPDKAYEEILGLIQEIGKITKKDKDNYIIKARVYSSDVVIRITENEEKTTEVKVKARKHMIPKFAIAFGITYQISKILK